MSQRYLAEEKPSIDDLAHYGVKGMKWGVKKAYAERQGKRVARYDRVSKGKGSKVDTVRTVANTSFHDLAKGKGVKGGAARLRDKEQAHINRVVNGEKKARDLLALYHRLRLTDIGRGLIDARNYKG